MTKGVRTDIMIFLIWNKRKGMQVALRIYNTLSRRKEEFSPVAKGVVSIYLCGPTVYENSHLGHALGPVVFDTIKRYLEHKGYKVNFVINITDVEDKIINRARELGKSVEALAQEVTANYLECMEKLGVTSVNHYPKASQHIQEMIDHIQHLIELGVAYELDGDVYFEVSKFADYGKLSGQRLEEMASGARVEVDQRKRHPADFALWKAAKPGEPSWPSPWGKGRPGWHIECSVMSMKYLGETFDIHGGGRELIFPHHENEIAQSEAATGKPFVRYWLHNGLMQLRGEKMSKSTGVLVPISELLERHRPETVRFFLLSSHYRSPIDFSEERLDEVRRALEGIHLLFGHIQRITGKSLNELSEDFATPNQTTLSPSEKEFLKQIQATDNAFHLAMDDDFNTAGAIATLFALTARTNKFIDSHRLAEPDKATEAQRELLLAAGAQIRRLGKILGLLEYAIYEYDVQSGGFKLEGDAETRFIKAKLPEEEIKALVEKRNEARRKGNYKEADRIRNDLASQGIILEDTPSGTIWRMK